jgi:YVTN family beta-propeller protein
MTAGWQDKQWRRVTRSARALLMGLALLSPVAAQAQVTAYAVIPSWTNKQVLVADAHTGATVAVIPLGGEPYDVAITPDGRYAYVTLRAGKRVTVIDLSTLSILKSIPVGNVPRGIAITPDGTRAFVTNAGSNNVSVIDVATNTVIGSPIPVGQMPWGIAITRGGDRAYVVNRTSSTVSAIDLVSQTVIAVMPVDQEPVEIMISPRDRMAYVTSTIANTVVPIDITSNTVLPSIPVGHFPRDLAITPDGRAIFVADSQSGTVSVVDPAQSAAVASIFLGTTAIPSGVTITPDGQHVLVSTETHDLRIIDPVTFTVLSTIPVGGQALRLVSGPNMVVPVPQGTPLTTSGDADLTMGGFGNYITFRGGHLQAANDFVTARHVSLLSKGGILDTQGFTVEIAGNTVNDGTLAKRGVGTLWLGGNSAHPFTQIDEGRLMVAGTHTGSIQIASAGILAGTGVVGNVDATEGIISPGVNGPGELHAGKVKMGTGHVLVIELHGVTPGLEYDRLVTPVTSGSVSLGDATLSLQPNGSMPSGAMFTIVTNATGTFAGLPEGAVIQTAFGAFRITYLAGPTQSDVAVRAF